MRARLLLVGLALLSWSLAACTPVTSDGAPGSTEAVDVSGWDENSDWVVVTFGGAGEPMPAGWMDALLPTEMAAIDALEQSGLGTIDGNDIGGYEYQLYFVGSDAAGMWEVLEPVFADAPVAWTAVELRDALDDPEPTRLTPRST